MIKIKVLRFKKYYNNTNYLKNKKLVITNIYIVLRKY